MRPGAEGDSLPEGMSVRAPRPQELEAVFELIAAHDVAEYGAADSTVDDLRGDWQRPGFELARDAWAVAESGGRIVGYADVWDREGHALLIAQGYVDPEYWGRGIGKHLVRLAEARARQHAELALAGARVSLTHIVWHANERARRLLNQEGYRPVRYYWRMVIEMEEPPPAPSWPQGISVRTFVAGKDDRAVHATVQEAFADNEGFAPYPLEEWSTFMIERESFDPTLWFLAVEGDEVAGVALCPRYEDTGWVRQVAVRRPWRRRGVALALLRQAFGEFYRRGKRTVGLVVDSYNRTGAKALYERAGMRAARQHDGYQKVLR